MDLIGDYLGKRSTGAAHPVIDFLFSYYSLRPSQLLRWHPGFGVTLTGAEAASYASRRGYRRTDDGVGVDPAFIERRRSTIAFVAELLAATASRPIQLACFGLHEWAMVYRDADSVRHRAVPLRLGRSGTDAVVESLPLRCTHYDAYRFFTAAAAPRNADQLSRHDQLRTEQPGCLHAGMDLYKYCYKLSPLIDSEFTADCFELAYQARVVDMRASPYDLAGYGYSPICIETAAGRAEFARQQSTLADRSAVLRAGLRDRCRVLLEHCESTGPRS